MRKPLSAVRGGREQACIWVALWSGEDRAAERLQPVSKAVLPCCCCSGSGHLAVPDVERGADAQRLLVSICGRHWLQGGGKRPWFGVEIRGVLAWLALLLSLRLPFPANVWLLLLVEFYFHALPYRATASQTGGHSGREEGALDHQSSLLPERSRLLFVPWECRFVGTCDTHVGEP